MDVESTRFGAFFEAVDTGKTQLSFTEDWAQGRAIFGGLIAALAIRLMQRQVGSKRGLRTLLTQFSAPVEPAPCEVETRVVRVGRSLTHLSCRFVQAGQERCTVLGAFGELRGKGVELSAEPRPETEPPEGLQPIPYIEGVVPSFIQHCDLRWCYGGVPFSGSDRAELGGWCRLEGAAPATAEERAVALVDAWPAPVLPLLKAPAPSSTLSWSIAMPRDVPPQADDGWWFFASRTLSAGNGYAQFQEHLWAPDGQIAAIGLQTAVVFT